MRGCGRSAFYLIWGHGNGSQNDAWFAVFYGLDTLNTSLNFYAYFLTGKIFREKVFQLLSCCRRNSAEGGNMAKKEKNVRELDELHSPNGLKKL